MTSRRGFAGLAVDSFPVPVRAPHPSHLEEPIAEDKRTRTALASLRPRPLRTVDDLLEHVPFRYDDFSRRVRIADLRPGEEATIVCTVDGVRLRRTRRRNLVIVEARVHDDSGPGVVVWFNQRYLREAAAAGHGALDPRRAAGVDRGRDRRQEPRDPRRRRRPAAHAGPGAGLPRPARRSAAAGCGCWRAALLPARGRPARPAALAGPQRLAAAAAPRRRSHARHQPRTLARGPTRRSAGSPSRSCSCSRWG